MGKETMAVQDIRKKLNVAELRATGQRALILEIIRHGQGHLDADEIYRRARQKLPHLNLSTVYRNLHRFKELGLVEERHFGESHHRYEVKPSVEHHHLVCLGCGLVIEFGFPLRRYLKRNVSEAKDFEIVDTEVRITGYCSKCRQSRE
jgi:Fur family ferric uptake transcriptional regulator